MSLFGSTTQQQKPSLFSLNTNIGTQASQPQQQTTGSLFGNTAQPQQQKPTLSLFGQPAAQNNATAGSGLFGNSQAQPQQPQQQQSSGLFGSTTQQPQAGGGLFGQPQQQQQQQQQKPSLFGGFGNSTVGGQQQQQPGASLFGQSQAQQQQQQAQQQQNLGASTLGGSVNNSSIWSPGPNMVPREKSVPEQMEVLLHKWNPISPQSVFQTYFYNQVPEEQAPYYAPGPGEDEQKWEEALKKKPTAGSIPVLARGPLAVGKRLEMQALVIRGLQARLHELNECLTKRLQEHDLQYSVRAREARRKHVVLSRRSLALATKVQLLRNRGYTLDVNEEQLKAKLQQLEKAAFDPMLSGRQEEIWARMSVLRDRAQLLKKEAEDFSRQVDGKNDGPLDAEQMKKIEKILSNYEIQLNQLKKEKDSAEADFAAWETTQQTSGQSKR